MKRIIIPSIQAGDKEELIVKIRLVENVTPWIQIDAADGAFVKNSTWYNATMLANDNILPLIELHLMVDNPMWVIDEWRDFPNFRRVIWHVEANVNHQSIIMTCRERGLECGLALAPKTKADSVRPFLSKIQTLLVLGVEPGISGQELIPETVDKVTELANMAPYIPIGFDGGVRPQNLAILADTGVSLFYMTSTIFNDENPSSFLQTQQAFLDSLNIPLPNEMR